LSCNQPPQSFGQLPQQVVGARNFSNNLNLSRSHSSLGELPEGLRGLVDASAETRLKNHMPNTKEHALQLRKNQTAAEIKLWGALRKRSLSGHKFVRQVPIGNYIVDFLCREKAFIIEVDGATHGTEDEIKYDAKRTLFLESSGFQVYRVGNADIYENLEGSLDGILNALENRQSLFKARSPLSPPDSSPNKLWERKV
jgi:very-short-patch-repair endonuclease